MNKFFINNAKTIWQLVKDRVAPDVGVAYSMFKADVECNTSENTGRADIDFAWLNEQWVELGEGGQAEAIEAWHKFYATCSKALSEAWVKGDDEAFQAIIDNA